MGLQSGQWYSATELFTGTAPQAGGFCEHHARLLFEGASLKALTGFVYDTGLIRRKGSVDGRDTEDGPASYYPALQVTLTGVPASLIRDLPAPVSLGERLIRESLMPLPTSYCSYVLDVETDGLTCTSVGLVCLALAVERPAEAPDPREVENRELVSRFSERGMIDAWLSHKADFRLENRPLMRKIGAMADSDYVPEAETALEVVFGHWQEADRTSRRTPLECGGESLSFSDLRFRFRDAEPSGGFRMTDLFR